MKAVTVDELHASLPHLYPDMEPPSCETSDISLDIQFSAVFLFTDPIAWGRETQIITDVISAPNGNIHDISKGIIQQDDTNNNYTQHIPVYNACADFTYSAKWPIARFGSGAFRVSLEKLWKELSNGKQLNQTLYGKPYLSQYQYVEKMLTSYVNGKETNSSSIVDRYYMVGDNPTTDIRGARSAGLHWNGILTRSGLWKGIDNDKIDPAHVVVDDVLEAVHWILEREGHTK